MGIPLERKWGMPQRMMLVGNSTGKLTGVQQSLSGIRWGNSWPDLQGSCLAVPRCTQRIQRGKPRGRLRLGVQGC
jgi:hypothetical protein